MVKQVSASPEVTPSAGRNARVLGAQRGGVRGADELSLFRHTRRPATSTGRARSARSTSQSALLQSRSAGETRRGFALPPGSATRAGSGALLLSKHATDLLQAMVPACPSGADGAARRHREGALHAGARPPTDVSRRLRRPLRLDWRFRDRTDPAKGGEDLQPGAAVRQRAQLPARARRLVRVRRRRARAPGWARGACRRVRTATRRWPVARGRRRPQRRARLAARQGRGR
jgi:hypothetical protein